MSFFDSMMDSLSNYVVTGLLVFMSIGLALAGYAIYLLIIFGIASAISAMRYQKYLEEEEERFDQIIEARGGNVKTNDILNSVFPGYEEAESPYSSMHEYVAGAVFGVGRRDEP